MAESKESVENQTNAALFDEDSLESIQEDFTFDEIDEYIAFITNQSQNSGLNPMNRTANVDDAESMNFLDEINLLSSSVGVENMIRPLDASHPIQLVYNLESEYKPRYKSDYFAQNGKTRPSRFVTDCNGKRCVTLQVLSGLAGWIRVDWVTVEDGNGHHYSMPYKFQTNHTVNDESGENPLYCPIQANNNGFMEFQLTLIKSKQDALVDVQPLQVFPPVQSNNVEQINRMSSKELIEKYKLSQSQLAFTYYLKNPNGIITYYWDTTVYSTIMTEQISEGSKKRTVRCPACSHAFEVNTSDKNDHSKIKRSKTE